LAAARASGSHGPARDRLQGAFPTTGVAVFLKDANGGWQLEHVLSPRDHNGGML
jgi:hypothetical protein